MPVKKKAAPATSSAAPARKTAAQSAASKPAAKASAKKVEATKKTARRTVTAHNLPPASSLPPAVLPPPAPKAGRTAVPVPETPGTALARAVADAADLKKAENIVILDVRGLSMITDFLVIASGSSMPHLRAIRNEISERIREDREEKPHSAQGMAESQWMLLDYGDVVAHVFLNEKRELYALEELWSDAPRMAWTPT